VRRFPGPEELAGLMARQGFGDVTFRRLGGGIVALHTGTAQLEKAQLEKAQLEKAQLEKAQ
jgi:uncharacterized protein YjbI with pentapeptide repeats